MEHELVQMYYNKRDQDSEIILFNRTKHKSTKITHHTETHNRDSKYPTCAQTSNNNSN